MHVPLGPHGEEPQSWVYLDFSASCAVARTCKSGLPDDARSHADAIETLQRGIIVGSTSLGDGQDTLVAYIRCEAHVSIFSAVNIFFLRASAFLFNYLDIRKGILLPARRAAEQSPN
jgi:hypothetical protein